MFWGNERRTKNCPIDPEVLLVQNSSVQEIVSNA